MGVGIFTAYTASTYRNPLDVLRDLVDQPERFSQILRERGDWGRPTATVTAPLGRTSTGTTDGLLSDDPRNGRLPDSELAAIPWAKGYRIHVRALPALTQLNDAYRARFGRNLSITSGYRTHEQQAALKLAKPREAAPAGQSNHGLGLAVDLGGGVNSFGTPEHNWMKANAPSSGWVQPSWAVKGGSKPEAWHWEFTRSVGGSF